MLFFKHFKIKKNITIKDSNRKKLIERVINELAVSKENADAIFNGKVATELKVSTNDCKCVMCYLFDDVPYVFIYENQLYPTVFLLYSVSSSNVPVMYVCDALIERIYRGSEIVPRCVSSSESMGSYSKSPVFSLAAYSGSYPDIQVSKPLAVCFFNSNSGDGSVLHFAKDKLSERCPPHLLQYFNFDEKCAPNSADPEQFRENSEQNDEGTDGNDELTGDNLLMHCFLYALCKLEKSDLPLLANVFYARYMKAECPKGSPLDIKKTSFKKVTVFLEKMANEGLITLETVPKGIIRVTSICKEHPKMTELLADFPDLENSTLDGNAQDNPAANNQQFLSINIDNFYFGPPTFEEQRIITSKIAPLLASAGYRVGEGISQAELCRIVGSYIDTNNLRCLEDRNLINVNKMLMHVSDANLFKEASGSTLADPKFQITFGDLIKSLTGGLKAAYKVTYPPKSGLSPLYISISKLPKIFMYVTAHHNKNVTRIGGLTNYGIDMKAFCKYIQAKLACSATLFEDPRSGNVVVVQTQGDHCVTLSELLTKTFKIPKQSIDGYQEPVKKGKKKSP